MGGLAGRIRRHLRRDKRLRWHIDYLTQEGTIIEVFWTEWPQRLECSWAHAATAVGGATPVVKGFGSSDCKCQTHLFYCEEVPMVRELERALQCPLSFWRTRADLPQRPGEEVSDMTGYRRLLTPQAVVGTRQNVVLHRFFNIL